MGAHAGGYPRRVAEIRDATPGDVDRVYELLDARNRAAFGSSELTRRTLEIEFQHVTSDRFVAERGDRAVGYAVLSTAHDVHVAAADADVADALLARIEDRARRRGVASITATVVPEDVPFDALVRRAGFAHHRDVLRMWRALDGKLAEPRWPVGATVRTYRSDDAVAVHELADAVYSAWDGSYVALPHDEWLALMTAHDEFDPGMWFLLQADGKLVAAALNWKEQHGRGWVKDLVVLPEARGQGLATALLHHAFRAYASRRVDRVGLKVDSTNPTGAARLYDRVGFRVDRRYGVWTKAL